MIAKEKLNILWSLEQTAEKYADRVAVSDVNQAEYEDWDCVVIIRGGCESGADLEGTCEESSGNRRRIK